MRKLTKTVSALLTAVMLMSVVLCAPFTVSAAETFTSGDYEYTMLDDGTAEITKCKGNQTGVVVPSELNGYKVTSIGNSAFFDCDSLTSITIPDSVTSIGDYAFNGCTSLISINVDKNNDSYSSLDEVLFDKKYEKIICYPAGKENLIYKIPDSVTSIGVYAFEYCFNLTSIIIPDSVTSISDDAFSDCYSLTSIIIPDSVTSIGEDAFRDCISLTSITIPDSVTSIGDEAFAYCESLTSITIPDSVTIIGGNAFYGCYYLTIYGYENTVAQLYAEENYINFVVLEKDKTIGDVNCDGNVDIKDTTLIQKYLAGLASFSDEQLALADTNGDGSVTVLDATEIQKYLEGLVTELG